ncbi:pseudouridine synthase [Vallitalea sp.]|jgi:23S rRNA pseudouridine2605 synthase|uniref:pseudouridine synthase n=1 Tax=Vallitalea sp. TaxID=1882829 RepID=UPI0025EA2886|nr:pseudouridine synthase [Vallitalea sp.]MCT4688308.1 rRNA pseudouridine synthase [Vallitalea sp.]
MVIRLQKYLADAGIASRRKCESYIIEGKVSVNGRVVKELGSKIDSDKDIVKYNGRIVKNNSNLIYIMLNKPTGYITSVSDEKGRKTVMDLIDINIRVYPIGRLDYNTSGLLLLTNDGDLTYKLTHPKHEVEKKYIVTVKGVPSEEKLNELRKGTDLGVYKTSHSQISVLQSRIDKTKLKVVIHEGKNRQVRKMFEHIGCPVIKLQRVAIGKLKIKGLSQGKYRHLSKDELNYIKNL